MPFAHSIGNTRTTFGSLRELPAKATPLRSEGLGPQQAAAELAGTLLEASRRQLTGVALKATPRMLEKG